MMEKKLPVKKEIFKQKTNKMLIQFQSSKFKIPLLMFYMYSPLLIDGYQCYPGAKGKNCQNATQKPMPQDIVSDLTDIYLQQTREQITDYRHTKEKSLILCGPNSNPNPKKIFEI